MRRSCYVQFVEKKNQQCRTRNWSQYNKALSNRGSITFWSDEGAINHNRYGKRGKPRTYGDACVECMPLLKSVYHPPQRSTHGLVHSLMQLMDLDLPTPHAPILSRRASSLDVALPRQSAGKSLHVLVDATGLKVYGEGEWEVRVRGYQKRRAWRKLQG